MPLISGAPVRQTCSFAVPVHYGAFGCHAPIASRPSPRAHRLAPIASRPSPRAHRLAPIASRPSPRAHRLAPIASRLSITLLVLILAGPGLATPALPPTPWHTNTQGGFVTALAEDGQGRLWAGTEGNGVWRCDPAALPEKQWTHFTAQNTHGGVGDDDIYALACDRLGRTWAGTARHGVSVRAGRRWENYDQRTGPLGAHVVALATSPIDGDVWGATEAGLFRYSLRANAWRYFTRADGLPSDQATCLAFGRTGALYVGTACDGLAIASPRTDYHVWRVVRGPDALPDAPGGAGLPTSQINCLLVSRSGTVYAGTPTGLARSGDGGGHWRFLRGADWRDKLAGLAAPVPPEEADTGGHLLLEDDVTALAEDGNRRLYAGHRRKGLGVYSEGLGEGTTPAGAYGGFVDALLVTGAGDVLVGSYGDGLVQTHLDGPETLTGPETRAAFGETAGRAAPSLPRPAAPPTSAQLNGMLRRVQSLQDTLPVGWAAYLGEDWATQGDWLGRYGRQYNVLCAEASPFNHVISFSRDFGVEGMIGPHHDPGDALRLWGSWPVTDNPKSLYTPVCGFRRQADWDDHGEAYSTSYEGPDIWVALTLPEGFYRVSLYFFNKDAHGWGPTATATTRWT